MMITYIIQRWNSVSNRYEQLWKGFDLQRAEIMFNKSYNRRSTRRMIKITEEILYKEKAQRS